MRAKKTEIHAIHDGDLAEFLERLDKVDAYRAGALKCSECGSAIRRGRLGTVRVREGQVLFSCSARTCLEAAHDVI